MILETIRQVYPHLSKSQKRLADFIASAYQQAAFMTASRMAQHLGVNEATVIRFAQRLGYQGYPEMIRDVQAVLQEELKAPEAAEAGQAAATALLAGLKAEAEGLQRGASHVQGELAQRLVNLLREGRRIYVAGQGASWHLAGAFAAGLTGVGLDGRAVPGDAEALAQVLALLREGDVLVGVAAAHESPEMARALTAARARGAHTLAVTRSTTSRMAQAADVALVCPAPSMGVAAAMLDALVQALASLDAAGARRLGRAVAEAVRWVRGDGGQAQPGRESSEDLL